MAAMGEMAFRLGRFEDAERYLARAVKLSIESGVERAEVHPCENIQTTESEEVRR